MKQFSLILSVLLMLYTAPLKAQTTYTSSDYMQIGDTMLYSQQTTNLNPFNFDTTGANISWDYSALTYQDQNTSFYVDPVNSGYQNIWCANNGFGPLACSNNFGNLTNLASRSLDSLNLGQVSITNRVSHQLNAGNVLQDRMIGLTAEISGIPIPFSFEFQNADSIYQFPLQYNITDSSTSRVVFDLSPAPVIQSRNAKRTNVIEGWGSLVTPYGNFPNVLKMKTTIERSDTLFLDTLVIPSNVTLVEYKWWDANYGLPVLIASGSIVGQTPVISSVRYLDSTRCVDPTSLFTFTPLAPVLDSATQSVLVNFNNLSTNADSVIWDLGDGTITTDYSPSNTYYCKGIRIISLITFNKCDFLLLSDTLVLTMYISDSTLSPALDTSAVSICTGDSILINGSYQNAAGFYFDINTGANGCDSTSIVQLQLITLPDTGVTINSGTLKADADSSTYQWLNCDNGFAPIPGATSQQYTPSASGSYAVEVTKNGCSAVSACYAVSIHLGFHKLNNLELQVFPNPAHDHIIVDSPDGTNLEYTLYSLTGRMLRRTRHNKIYLGDLASGTYMLKVVDANGEFSTKLIQKLR